MAHSSGYRIISQQRSSLSSVSARRERRPDFETLSFFTKLFQTVCSVCLTIQTQFISDSSRGFRFHFNFLFLSFFMCGAFCRAQRECGSLFRYSGKRKERPSLVAQDKNLGNCCNSAIVYTQFSDLAGSTVNGQLSCLIQQPERWPGIQGLQHGNAG